MGGRHTGSVPARYDGDVQLGEFDVPAEVINAPGGRLKDVLGTSREPYVDDMMGPPPTDGWRVIAGDMTLSGEDGVVLAAPWDNPRGNGWMMIGVGPPREGDWWAVIMGDDRPVRASRARRRAGLQLAWASPAESQVIASGQDVPELDVVLTNIGQTTWFNYGTDDDAVFIDVLDLLGASVARRNRGRWAKFGGRGYRTRLIPDLGPGETHAVQGMACFRSPRRTWNRAASPWSGRWVH